MIPFQGTLKATCCIFKTTALASSVVVEENTGFDEGQMIWVEAIQQHHNSFNVAAVWSHKNALSKLDNKFNPSVIWHHTANVKQHKWAICSSLHHETYEETSMQLIFKYFKQYWLYALIVADVQQFFQSVNLTEVPHFIHLLHQTPPAIYSLKKEQTSQNMGSYPLMICTACGWVWHLNEPQQRAGRMARQTAIKAVFHEITAWLCEIR